MSYVILYRHPTAGPLFWSDVEKVSYQFGAGWYDLELARVYSSVEKAKQGYRRINITVSPPLISIISLEQAKVLEVMDS